MPLMGYWLQLTVLPKLGGRSEIIDRYPQNCRNRMLLGRHDPVHFRPRHRAGDICRLGCCILQEAGGGVAGAQPALGLGRCNSLPGFLAEEMFYLTAAPQI